MNERIREFAEQCVGSRPYNTFDYEKFAELIVKESIMQMAVQMDKFGDNQSNNPIWYKSEEAVKKHFGIKE